MNPLDPHRYPAGSLPWQVLLIVRNLLDPRLAGGLLIIILALAAVMFGYARLYHYLHTLPPVDHEQSEPLG